MPNFDEDIQKFQRYGTYTYKFDSVGNFLFDGSSNDFSRVHLSLPLLNIKYNNNKISAFQKPSFEEFIPTETVSTSINSEELQQKLNVVSDENDNLKKQLNELITQSESNSKIGTDLSTKQVILELRKELGQGRFDSDFSSDFPYTPIVKENTQTE